MNNISIRLDRLSQAKYLNDCILHGINNEDYDITVTIENSFTGSNVCAPIAGVIDHYTKIGVNIQVVCPPDSYANHVRLFNPIAIEDANENINPFDKVFSFSSDNDVAKIVSMYLVELRKSDEIENGIIQGLEWCMNETIDNVLQHSGSNKGFVMAQVHKHSKSFNFCVFDTGIGIYNSFKNSSYSPKTPLEAIELSLKEHVTSDVKKGQGNGLWGLSQIIKESNGRLVIRSGGACYNYINGEITTVKNGDFNLGKKHGTTMIDFQLDYSLPIDVPKALNGYIPIDLWTENHENDLGEIEIDIFKEANGTGTRKSAEKMRNIVINFLKAHYSIIKLDFKDVSMMSSSFADELIGKLIVQLGFSKFIQHIIILNLNELNSSIVNRSVGQRMAQIYMEEKINEDDDE